jgi:hypothetical protein
MGGGFRFILLLSYNDEAEGGRRLGNEDNVT